MTQPRDVAELLEVGYDRLKYHLYIAPDARKYTAFSIPKSSGGQRAILAPISALKIIQRKLAHVLEAVYMVRAPVHGFVQGRSILTNARYHARKRYVLNVDIQDFFPSINFGRVRGMFMATPYNLQPPVATVLAQICCFDNQLPQGAPTSPIVSNMICAKLDSELRLLARDNRSFYTRYADDLTFSTTTRRFPGSLASILPTGEVRLGRDLLQLIESNGFTVNNNKLRLQSQYQRQEVTGLTVNLFPNVPRKFVRQIRAMLHDWEKNGLERAEERHSQLVGARPVAPFKEYPPFSQIVKGKIDFLGMVKGRDDPNYRRFLYKYAELNPEYSIAYEGLQPLADGTRQATVFTSGKTDWRHLKAALRQLQASGKFRDLDLHFREEDDDIGDDKLVSMCDAFSKSPLPHPVLQLFIFDRDNHRALRAVGLVDKDVADRGKSVYAIALPIPVHREDTPEICIELLYKDHDLTMVDSQGRRIFLTNEFQSESGWHLKEQLVYQKPARVKYGGLGIIDGEVFDRNGRNVALSKAQFAEYVLRGSEPFNSLDVAGFEPVFHAIESILAR